MFTRRKLRQLLQEASRDARRAARALRSAGRALAERLAYRPREVVVVALLAGGLFAGLAVERWRARHPGTAERLEAEPPRPTSAAAVSPTPRPRPRGGAPRCDPWTGRTADVGHSGAGRPRLDLNRATARQLARLAGISWSLAARIVAARDAVEGREAGTVFEPPGPERDVRYRQRRPTRLPDETSLETDATPTSPASIEPPPSPESPGEDSPDPAPQ